MIYKLLASAEWAAAQMAGRYDGSAVDREDGFIHLSGPDQVVETARRYFADKRDLVLLAVDPDRIGPELRWEASRGGALFPHIYGPLPLDAVLAEHALPNDRPVPEAVADLIR